MAKWLNDLVHDALLDKIATADQLVLCEGQPASYADATTDKGAGGNALGETALDGGDFAKANGDVSGRKITIAQKTGIPADVSGDWDHVALVDDALSLLLLVTPLAYAAILAVDTATDTITIEGDVTAQLASGDRITIRGSTGNDGGWTVDSVALSGSDTDVTVTGDITDATADGICIHGAQQVTAGNSVTSNAFAHESRDVS